MLSGVARRVVPLGFLFAGIVSTRSIADDWETLGGNTRGNGWSSTVTGPRTDSVHWTQPWSGTAFQPLIVGGRLLASRSTFGSSSDAGWQESELVMVDLNTGVSQWVAHLPPAPNGWSLALLAARDSRVFAGRQYFGQQITSEIFAFDVETGHLQWTSDAGVVISPYTGAVFAPNGDLIIGNSTAVVRFDSQGALVWNVPRRAGLSADFTRVSVGSTGVYAGAEDQSAHYIVEKRDLGTGAVLYTSQPMSLAKQRFSPIVAPTDQIVALDLPQKFDAGAWVRVLNDTGSSLVEQWSFPVAEVAFTEPVANADSVVAIDADYHVVRLALATGAVVNRSTITVTHFTSLAIDAEGKVYVSEPSSLRVLAPDLSLLWSAPLSHSAGPVALGGDQLVVATSDQSITAWRVDGGLRDAGQAGHAGSGADAGGDAIIDAGVDGGLDAGAPSMADAGSVTHIGTPGEPGCGCSSLTGESLLVACWLLAFHRRFFRRRASLG